MSASKSGRALWARFGAEFLVIFAGVTLSLAADDWRQQREDREQAFVVLSDLRDDLDLDSAQIVQVRGRSQDWDRGALWLRDRLRNGPPIPTDSLTGRLLPVSLFMDYQPTDVAYTALKEGGRMALIPDARLRSSIRRYYEVDQQVAVRFDTEQNIPLNIAWRELLWSHFEVPIGDGRTSHWPPEFVSSGSWAEFAADRDVRSRLNEVGVTGSRSAQIFDGLLRANRELAGRTDEVLAELRGGGASGQ